MTVSAAAAPLRGSSHRAALTALYLAVSTLAFVLFSGHTTAGGGLWFPPAGIAFGYLLVSGWRCAWVVVLARTLGGLLTFSGDYSARPALSVAVDAITTMALVRSFLPSITDDEQARALVSLVLGLAELLHMDVVAEGVESWAQRNVLVDLGCRRAQGYLYSRPASGAAIATLLSGGGYLRAGPEQPDVEPHQQLRLALGAPLR